ncbi:MAG: radical SAM protein [Nitrospinae bacterium]|nr:radical SAM protein [Nitrospinota bacterium]
MTRAAFCDTGIFRKDGIFYRMLTNPERESFVQNNLPYHITFELTSKCHGSCAYCYNSSDEVTDYFLPPERVYRLVDEAKEIGPRMIIWHGGDPLLHPQCFDFMRYSTDQGFQNMMVLNPMMSKQVAKQICDCQVDMVTMHIDTIDQEAYNQVHTNPKTLEAKVQGYRNLLEAGFPPQNVAGILTLTRPMLHTISETVDWFVHQMGASFVCFEIFRAEGFGKGHYEWEPSLSELKKAYEDRARVLGDMDLLRMGTMDISRDACKSHFVVTYEGQVKPCVFMVGLSLGNIYQEGLVDLFHKHRDRLLYNFDVKGYCGEECENRGVCWGCRAVTYYYTGDVQASDPKCWWNPDNSDYFFQASNNS